MKHRAVGPGGSREAAVEGGAGRPAVARGSLVALLAVLAADPVQAGRFWDDAEKACLLREDTSLPAGTQRHGFTWHHYPNTNQRPAKGIPNSTGWYKPASQGSTSYWEDKNGNGAKDDGEVRAVPYWIYFRTKVSDRYLSGAPWREVAGGILAAASFGQPAARRVAGVLRDEPAVVVGRDCLASGPGLELIASTDTYLVFDLGKPTCWGVSGLSWLNGFNRNDPASMPRRFPAMAEIDGKVRALHAGPCGKASAEAALAMVAAWTRQVAGRVGDGPGFKGYYPPDCTPWYPEREDLPAGHVRRVDDSGWGRGVSLEPVGAGPRAAVKFTVRNELSDTEDEPMARAKQTFADESRGYEGANLAGAEEARIRRAGTTVDLMFRRLNVVVRVSVSGASGAKTPAKSEALARRLAEVVLLKMRGAPAVPPVVPPEPRHVVTVERQGGPEAWLGECQGSVRVRVVDGDGDPVIQAPVLVMPADPSVGMTNLTQVHTNGEGEATLRYSCRRPGSNRLLVETAAGRATQEIMAGGFMITTAPAPETRDGTIAIKIKAVDAVGLQPMAGVPVNCSVDDSKLPQRGQGPRYDQQVRTNAAGEAVFSYRPPAIAGSPTQGRVIITASADAVGYPQRFSNKVEVVIPLPSADRS